MNATQLLRRAANSSELGELRELLDETESDLKTAKGWQRGTLVEIKQALLKTIGKLTVGKMRTA